MKVYIITNESYPYGMAAASRISCYAKAILLCGMQCEVLIFKRTEVSGSNTKNVKGKGVYDGINFTYISGKTQRNKNPFIRRFQDFIDRHKTISYLYSNLKKGDVILTYMREDDFCTQLFKLSRRTGIPVVRDLCEYPYATQAINSQTITKSESYLTKKFPSFSGAVCISEALLEVAKKYHPNGKFIKIPILIDENIWDFTKPKSVELGYPYIFHSGTLFQQKDGIVEVLSAFHEALPFLPKGTKFLFTGKLEKSRDKLEIQNVINKYQLQDNIRFLGYLSHEELLSYIKGASLFIINKKENLQNKYCFATKLGEYLLSGNPIITTKVGEAANYLINGRNAYVIDDSCVNSIKEAIIQVFSTKDASKIGLEGAKLALNSFTYSSQAHLLADYLKSLSR